MRVGYSPQYIYYELLLLFIIYIYLHGQTTDLENESMAFFSFLNPMTHCDCAKVCGCAGIN